MINDFISNFHIHFIGEETFRLDISYKGYPDHFNLTMTELILLDPLLKNNTSVKNMRIRFVTKDEFPKRSVFVRSCKKT